MSQKAATFTGFIAVLLWSLLALFTAASGHVPPFQLSAMAFSVAGIAGLIMWLFEPHRIRALPRKPAVWLVGVGGLFGYHFFYFTALRNAPPIEAGLIAYLWPLLIVVFSALLPGERLRAHHVLGAILGFSGAALIVTGGGSFSIEAKYAFGYAMALGCALIWSGYSVLSRRFADVPTDIVTGYCLASAALSFACHVALEQTVWPDEPAQWLAILGLGLGPVGLAFFFWDHGVKHGDIQVLGAASYAAPLLSTLVLVVFGFSQFTWVIGLACLLITLGAVIAAKDMVFGK